MTVLEKIKIIEEIKSNERMIKELQQLIDSDKALLKDELNKVGKSEEFIGGYVVRNTKVVSEKFDSKSFKSSAPELYKKFTYISESFRFSIN